jgi:thiamine pyridinylase
MGKRLRKCWLSCAAVFLLLGVLNLISANAEQNSSDSGGSEKPSPSALRTSRRCRLLKVVLYPFIPDYQGFARQVAKKFAASNEGKGIDLEFVDLTDGYYDSTSDEYVGGTTADVYEVDSVLLAELAGAHRIRPLPAALTPSKGEFLETAQRRAFVGDTAYGYPQWVCANFLFYRSDDAGIANAKTLAALEGALGSQAIGGKWLLADLKGKSTLGEFYLMSLFDRYGNWSTVQAHLGTLQREQVHDIVRLAALCDHGYCHDGTRHDFTGAYGREFAHGRGRVLIGYSEILYDVGLENALCSKSDSCLSADNLGVSLVPLDDAGATPMVWVDTLTVASSCTGQCESDATAFIRFVNSEQTLRDALIGFPPRYLMPARASVYSDPVVLKAAPLYPRFKSLVENADAPSAEHLNDTLRNYGRNIDACLPNGCPE